MTWITDDAKIVEWLYNRKKNDTFAVTYGSPERTEYATVVGGPYHDVRNYYETTLAEPYNIVAECNLRRNPGADFSDKQSISHDPDAEDVYVKTGVSTFDNLEAICTEPLTVDYESHKKVIAKCDNCGTKTELNLTANKSTQSSQMRRDDGDLITPCCLSEEWTTKLVDE